MAASMWGCSGCYEQLGHMATLGRLAQEVEPAQRPLPHHGAGLREHGVLQQRRAPLGEQPQRVVQRGRVRLGLGGSRREIGEQPIPDMAMQTQAPTGWPAGPEGVPACGPDAAGAVAAAGAPARGKCAVASARTRASSVGSLVASANRS